MPSTHTQLVAIDLPKPSLMRLLPRCSPSIVRMAFTTLAISEYWQKAYDDTTPCFLMSISCKTVTISMPDRSPGYPLKYAIMWNYKIKKLKCQWVSFQPFPCYMCDIMLSCLQALVLLLSIEYNSLKPAPIGPDVKITKYTGLPDSTYTDLNSYK